MALKEIEKFELFIISLFWEKNLNKVIISVKNYKYINIKLAYSTVGTPDYIAPEVFG